MKALFIGGLIVVIFDKIANSTSDDKIFKDGDSEKHLRSLLSSKENHERVIERDRKSITQYEGYIVEVVKKTISEIEQKDQEDKNELISRREAELNTFKQKIYGTRKLIAQSELEDSNKIRYYQSSIVKNLSLFPPSFLLAEKIATELAPADYQSIVESEEKFLYKSFIYWGQDTLATAPTSSRMLARTWEDEAWRSSYQPQIKAPTPDCIRIGNYLIRLINPETNQELKARMQLPAMVPVRAFRSQNQP